MLRMTHPSALLAFVVIMLACSIAIDRVHAQEVPEIQARLSARFPIGCTPSPFDLPGSGLGHCNKPKGADRQFLVVQLGKDFDAAKDVLDEVYVTASDGSKSKIAIKSREMGVEGLTLVFAVAASADDFTLHWPEREPIELMLETGS